jgi:hypothetical protein
MNTRKRSIEGKILKTEDRSQKIKNKKNMKEGKKEK